MKKIVFYLILLVSIFSFSADINEKTFSLPDFITLKGVYPEYNYTFFIDNFWDLKESNLKIKITQSQIKNYKDSTLTVFINDTPVNTVMLKDLQNNSDVDLNIDKSVIKKGFNNLKIKVFHKINSENCVLDDVDTGNWIVLDKATELKIHYEILENTENLLNYPFTYVKEDGSLDAVIALPENVDNDEIAAALTMALFLGRKAPFYNNPVRVIKSSEISDTDSNIILISKANKLDTDLTPLTQNEISAVENNNGLIKEIGIKNKKLLLITGKNQESLKNSLRALTDENLYFQLNSDSNIIGNIDLPDYEKIIKSTFSDFGYKSIFYSGGNEKIFNYNFALDRNTEYDNVKIKINFKHSDNIDYSVSEVTAFVNDIPVASEKLEKLLADNNSMEFPVPSDLIIKGNINLKLRFFLGSNGSKCNSSDANSPWVLVSDTSKIDVKHKDRNFYRLGTYPGPFLKDYRLNNTGFVIPKNISLDELNYLTNIAFYLGKNTTITDYVEVYNDIVKDKNLIVYGLSQEKYIKDINNKLYLKYDDTFNRFEKNEKISFINNNKLDGVLQIIKEKDNYIIVVTAAQKNEAMLALSYLTGNYPNLRGDVMIVDETGKTKSFYYLNDTSDLSDQPPKLNYNLIALFIVIICTFILSIIFILMQKKGEKK